MWGQVYECYGVFWRYGIIPTRVGTSDMLVASSRSCRDHPHACGDKSFSFFVLCPAQGSSPRVWGQGHLRNRRRHKKRIIPTRMGTSRQAAYLDGWSEDHPHAYGDKPYTLPFAPFLIGSSPRVWGQGSPYMIYSLFGGIIPTRMGTR